MGAVMGTVHQRDNLLVENGLHIDHAIFNFKPYKLVFGYCNSRCRCQNMNRNDNHEYISPKPRSGHRIVCDDKNMYSFGGYNPSLTISDEADLANDTVWADSKPLFKELWKYNISTGSWKKLDVEDIPDILASNAVLLSGRVLMVYGGTGVPFGANCSKDLYICDLSKENPFKFTLISALGNCPQPQYGQAIVLKNNYLYTVGGTTGFEYTCDVHRLNLRDKMWEAVYICKGTQNEPPGRYRHEIAFDQDKIYILGGGTSHSTYGFQQQQKSVEPGMWVGVFCSKEKFCQVLNKVITTDAILWYIGPTSCQCLLIVFVRALKVLQQSLAIITGRTHSFIILAGYIYPAFLLGQGKIPTLLINATENPLSLDSSATFIFLPPKFSLINFYSCQRTANCFRCYRNVVEVNFMAERIPVHH
ncbi:Kelch domain-containing protein 10 [Homalodisca vitripennis]|nr:Kelch domain-containing protein 10 [Homalodisca vitripennis]